MTSKTDQLRELIHNDEPLVAPGVFDALSARIVESLGFDAIYLGGYATGASTAHTEPITTMTEMCLRAREITSNVDIPLIVDGDAGFGNAPHTYRTVKEFSNSGIAGMHIEDQVYPKRLHYHAGVNRITEPEEVIHKIKAGLESRVNNDADIVLMARTDEGRGQRRDEADVGIEDAVNRVNRFIDAGAEVGQVFPQSMDELQYAADNVSGPLKVTVSKADDPCPTVSELHEIGVDLAVYPTDATAIAAKAVDDMYSHLRDYGELNIEPSVATKYRERVERLIGLPKYYEIERREGKK